MTRAARRVGGHHEVGAVNDVGRPTNHSIGGRWDVTPCVVKWSGRHRPVAPLDPERQRLLHGVTLAPADREGPDLDVDPMTERAEHLPAEHPDAGAVSDQRRAVQGDHQARLGRLDLGTWLGWHPVQPATHALRRPGA